MDPQLSAQLAALAAVIIGSLGLIVRALTERITRELSRNTTLTEEAKEAANGRLSAVLRDLAKERDRTLALRELVRERDNRIAYLTARLPQAEALMSEYGRRREDRRSRTEEHTALQRMLDEIDDPTGSDAGRFSPPQ